MEAIKKKQNYIGDNPNSKLVLLTDVVYPRLLITFGGNDAIHPEQEIDVDSFIAVKGFKAKGKRLTTFEVNKIEELEPLHFPEEIQNDNVPQKVTEESTEDLDPDAGKSQQQVIDEITGQLNLFSNEDLDQ